MRSRLGVHVDDVIRLRRMARGRRPDPVDVALAAERAGVESIALRLDADLLPDARVLRQVVEAKLTVRMEPVQESLTMALELRPDRVVFVPDLRDGLSGDALGLDLVQSREAVQRGAALLKEAGIDVGVRVEPEIELIRSAHKAGANFVDLNTTRFEEARNLAERSESLARLRDAAKTAKKLGLWVVAGDGLAYGHLPPVGRIAEIGQVDVGHAVVARALLVGFEQACRDLVDLLRDARIDLLRS